MITGSAKITGDTDPKFKKFMEQMNASDKAIKIGILGSKTIQGKETSEIATYAAANEFGEGRIPERSFLRSTLDVYRKEILEEIKRQKYRALSWEIRPGKAIELIGLFASMRVKERITKSKEWAEPNAVSTIKRKTHGKLKDQPLIDTGRLRQSITYEVE